MVARSQVFRIALLLIVALSVSADGATDIRTHWQEGETRTYHFRMGIRSLGTHTARFVEAKEAPGIGVICLFEMDVNLDMTSVGHDFKTERACSLFCSAAGFPLRYVVDYRVGTTASSIDAVIQRGVFRGSADGIGLDSTFEINIPPETYLCDNDFIAQWQMVFADIDLQPGDTHTVDILIPEDMRRVPISLVVIGTEPVAVGNESVLCTVVSAERINYRFYVGPDRKIHRVVEPRQGLVIDLMPSGESDTETSAQTGTFWRTLPRRALIWTVYAVWGLIFLAFLGRDGMSRLDSWAVLAVAGGAFGLVFAVQAPVQREVAKTVFTAIGARGVGIYIGAFITALVSGTFQEALKMAPVWLNWYRLEQKPNLGLMMALGAAAGAGFGVVEACWLTGGAYAAGHVGLVSPVIWERLVTVFFHVGTGALLGYGVGRKQLWQYWLLAATLHTFASFTVVFLRQGFVDAMIFLSFLTIFYLAVLFIAKGALRKIQRR
jgi:hypothetical protein